jgi:hypothetical protein
MGVPRLLPESLRGGLCSAEVNLENGRWFPRSMLAIFSIAAVLPDERDLFERRPHEMLRDSSSEKLDLEHL